MIALLALGATLAAENEITLDRVDFLSADPGTFLNYDVPMIAQAHPSATGIRFLEQVQVVLGTPLDGLYLGVSISSQSFVMEQPVAELPVDAVRLVPDNLFVYGGVQTNTLIPRGLMLGAGWRAGPVRTSLGLSLLSNASWRRLDYGHWHALPTISVGVGRKHASP